MTTRAAPRSRRICLFSPGNSPQAGLLARYEPEQAWQFLLRALETDIADAQGGTTAEGIHLGAMAGTIDLVQRCLTGMRARGAVLQFGPALPPAVKQLRFSVHYRGHRLEVRRTADQMRIESRPGTAPPITVQVGDKPAQLASGGHAEVDLTHRS